MRIRNLKISKLRMKHVQLKPFQGLRKKNDHGHIDSSPTDAQGGVSPQQRTPVSAT